MAEHTPSKHFNISIDREHFAVREASLTGAQLRALPSSPIGEDRDLFEEVRGPGEDRLISDDEAVEMRNGLKFFSAPRTITPG